MSESKYIGRAEVLTKKILLKIVECVGIQQQVNIKDIVLAEDYDILDQEVKNHNFDLVVRRTHRKDIVVEVNFKHGGKADYKWNEIFVPLIIKSGKLALPINDYECEHLFFKSVDGTHAVTWQDYMDIMNCMTIVGIDPDVSLD